MHELPKLKYAYGDLEPFIDARTMEIHYSKHHQAYVNKLNEALEKYSAWQGRSVEELLRLLDKLPADIRIAVRNNGGGHFNHSFFWKAMGKDKGGEPSGKLSEDIKSAFGSFKNFKDQFSKQANGFFGSGWVWLCADGSGKLKIVSTQGHDNPIMAGEKPILVIDVWEHAYYLKYQNRRPEYVENWWNVVDWDFASEMHLQN